MRDDPARARRPDLLSPCAEPRVVVTIENIPAVLRPLSDCVDGTIEAIAGRRVDGVRNRGDEKVDRPGVGYFPVPGPDQEGAILVWKSARYGFRQFGAQEFLQRSREFISLGRV